MGCEGANTQASCAYVRQGRGGGGWLVVVGVWVVVVGTIIWKV